MTGLLLKDLIGLKSFARFLVLLLVIYIGIGVFTGELFNVAAAMLIVCAMLPMSSLALDEQSSWRAFACALPVRRGQLVAAKYLLVVVLEAASVVLLALVGGVTSLFSAVNWQELLLSVGIIGLLVLLMNALTMPMMYKFGVEKARLLMMLVFMIVFLAFSQMQVLQQAVLSLGALPLWLAPVAVIALYVGSCYLSIRIYERKEF